MTTERQQQNRARAVNAGLVVCHFSNGQEWRIFESRCDECRHFIEDRNDPSPPKLTPPHNLCAWGILDRIIDALASQKYPYGESVHSPEDIDPSTFPATCLRFTHRDDRDGEFRDPPPPDCEGQMFLGDVTELMLRNVLEIHERSAVVKETQ